jgi:hypothetical protein
MITGQLAELRAWVGTWSGKLALAAAAVGTALADNAVTTLGLAEFIPEGWPRVVVLIGVALATFIAPKAAAKKDAAVADAAS